jgi:hypothetical protein
MVTVVEAAGLFVEVVEATLEPVVVVVEAVSGLPVKILQVPATTAAIARIAPPTIILRVLLLVGCSGAGVVKDRILLVLYSANRAN